jgi:hypothetical protein
LLAIAGAVIVLVTAAPVAYSNIPEVAWHVVGASTIAWIVITCVACAIAASMGTARVILGSQESPMPGIRMAVGSLAVGVANIVALSLFGPAVGIAAVLVGMSFAVASWRTR